MQWLGAAEEFKDGLPVPKLDRFRRLNAAHGRVSTFN
jgi:hypothetical protein